MKRGQSGLSCVVGVNKSCGMSSHDVVNACRRIFSEKRIGHAGTLDPLASGVLPVLVGPATRLDRYLTGHDKTYIARVAFGSATATDDAEGAVIKQGPLIPELYEESFACDILKGFLGPQKQIPPAYSAIKVNGVRAYAASRKGNVIDLAPRDIDILAAELIDIEDIQGELAWCIQLTVSKGTYIRAIARDIGRAVGVPAHLAGLARTRCGMLDLVDCVSLEALTEVRETAALDPIKLLGFPIGFVAPACHSLLDNGNMIDGDSLTLFDYPSGAGGMDPCACTSGLRPVTSPSEDGGLACIVSDASLRAIYRYESAYDRWKPDCIFSTGVSRGHIL